MISEKDYHEIDRQTIQNWIYPTNYPVREYQLEICKKALFINTLVCLPTGLGKTLIAAVVIYNYYRWFPKGKIIFMAPTRPLVNQQMKACSDIMCLPEEHTTHLEGSISADKRNALWEDHRVIFCTPQTAHNDLKNHKVDSQSIVCIVVDEAHKATGDYAYTKFVEELYYRNKQFRLLALSATPGVDVRKIQLVVHNLKIAHIEIRTEEDSDVAQYVHERHIEIVKCQENLVPIAHSIRDEINKFIEIPLLRLYQAGIVMSSSPANMNKFVANEIERYWNLTIEEKGINKQQENQLKIDFQQISFMLECRKIFNENSIGGLYKHLEENKEKYPLPNDIQYLQFCENIIKSKRDPDYLGKKEPKIKKLKEILADHFLQAEQSTRALIFCQFRSSVVEVTKELAKVPGLKPREFIGQGISYLKDADGDKETAIGLTQAEQASILRQFNIGEYNVLVATSIAEEGLDIAEVDLIILLDAIASPTRLVQRIGRTGRKRAGRVVLIASENSKSKSSENNDEDKLIQSRESVKSLNNVLKKASRAIQFFPHNPTMIPNHIPVPTLVYKEMKMGEKENNHSQHNIQSLVVPNNQSTSSSSSTQSAKNLPIKNFFFANNDPFSSQNAVSSTSISSTTSSNHNMKSSSSRPKEIIELDNTFDEEDDPFGFTLVEEHEMTQIKKANNNNTTSSSSAAFISKSNPTTIAPTSFANSFLSDFQDTSINSKVFRPDPSTSSAIDRFFQQPPTQLPSSSTSHHIYNLNQLPTSYSKDSTSSHITSSSSSNSLIHSRKSSEEHLSHLTSSKQPTSPLPKSIISTQNNNHITDLTSPPRNHNNPLHNNHNNIHHNTHNNNSHNNNYSSPQRTSSVASHPHIRIPAQPIHHKPILQRIRNVVSSVKSFVPFIQQSMHKMINFTPPISDPPSQHTSDKHNNSHSRVSFVSEPILDEVNDPIPSIADFPQRQQKNRHLFTAEETFDDSFEIKPRSLHANRPPKAATKPLNLNSISPSGKLIIESKSKPIPSNPISPKPMSSKLIPSKPSVTTTTSSSSNAKISHKPPLQSLQSLQSLQTDIRCCVCVGKNEPNTNQTEDLQSSGDDEDKIIVNPTQDIGYENEIIHCKGACGQWAHLDCYIPEHEDLDFDDFYCEACVQRAAKPSVANNIQCALCFQSTGMMRKATSGEFVHMICVLFTPELCVNVETMRLSNIENLFADRQKLLCRLCKQRGGSIVQCSYGDCTHACHPYCAYTANYQMIHWTKKGQEPRYDIYCPSHEHILPSKRYIITHLKPIQHQPTTHVHTPSKNTKIIPNTQIIDSSEKRSPLEADRFQIKRGTKRKRLKKISELLDLEAKRTSKKKKKKYGEEYFELEAVLSDTDRSECIGFDDDDDEEDDDEDSKLSGDFINDSSFTQDGTPPGVSLYFQVNRTLAEKDSPEEVIDGKYNIKSLVTRKKNAFDDDEVEVVEEEDDEIIESSYLDEEIEDSYDQTPEISYASCSNPGSSRVSSHSKPLKEWESDSFEETPIRSKFNQKSRESYSEEQLISVLNIDKTGKQTFTTNQPTTTKPSIHKQPSTNTTKQQLLQDFDKLRNKSSTSSARYLPPREPKIFLKRSHLPVESSPEDIESPSIDFYETIVPSQPSHLLPQHKPKSRFQSLIDIQSQSPHHSIAETIPLVSSKPSDKSSDKPKITSSSTSSFQYAIEELDEEWL